MSFTTNTHNKSQLPPKQLRKMTRTTISTKTWIAILTKLNQCTTVNQQVQKHYNKLQPKLAQQQTIAKKKKTSALQILLKLRMS
jgi:hypothetical protein